MSDLPLQLRAELLGAVLGDDVLRPAFGCAAAGGSARAAAEEEGGSAAAEVLVMKHLVARLVPHHVHTLHFVVHESDPADKARARRPLSAPKHHERTAMSR